MTETRNYYTTSSNYTDHTTFSGIINLSDFGGHLTLSDIAARIVSDQKFDEMCRNNIKNRYWKQNHKEEQTNV